MKKWFLERFLPMWAKETVYKDNRRLLDDNRALLQENQQLRAYIRGMHAGARAARRKEKISAKCTGHSAK